MEVPVVILILSLTVLSTTISSSLLGGSGGLLVGGSNKDGRAKAYSGLGYGGGSSRAPGGGATADAYGQGMANAPGSAGEGSGFGEGHVVTPYGETADAYASGYGKQIGVGSLADVGYGRGKASYKTSGGQTDSASSTTVGSKLHLPTGEVELAPTVENR